MDPGINGGVFDLELKTPIVSVCLCSALVHVGSEIWALGCIASQRLLLHLSSCHIFPGCHPETLLIGHQEDESTAHRNRNCFSLHMASFS